MSEVAGKLFSIEVDGHGAMIARIDQRESARVQVRSESTEAHVAAAQELVQLVFEDLRAQGYPHAYDDDDDFSRPTEDMEVEV